MDGQRKTGARSLRRLRTARGWSWTELATQLRLHARTLHIQRIGAAQLSSIRRTIGRWESAASVPDEQYQLLLAYVYARTSTGSVALGPGSDFRQLLETLALLGALPERLDEIAGTVSAAVTDSGTHLLAFLGAPVRNELAGALARPESLSLSLLDALAELSRSVDQRIGTVPFVRLYLVQAAAVEACRHLLVGEHPAQFRSRLWSVAACSFALAARLAFETHDDVAALNLYAQAVEAAGEADPSERALIRSSQTMVVYYSTGDLGRARRIADAAVQDARRGESRLMRARAHALQAEMAVRGEPVRRRDAEAALHLAWHDLDGDTSDDPMAGSFSKGRLRGFEGVCGIFLGEAEGAERRLAESAEALKQSRESVQRAIVLTDRALARLRASGAGAPQSAAELLHECVDLIAATRGRVAAQRLRRARLELRTWRRESFVADLDDHIHTALVGI
ncbi:hypothetical protein SAMN05443665_100260 [Actinomadura meyerae]|uniref:HTH cro/C1-type domain-containing protein n=1 Tax=Actinomadura meyerae TaxID=240840 RepID=A0A239D1T3_9ACTN|nr:hypothetical protein [Actinomadura meyerae]SNS25988.1 hypothetical protein SAMN05443665_100260 [Actinomadura meyerae]